MPILKAGASMQGGAPSQWANKLAEKCADAYSTDRYGGDWGYIVRSLWSMGLDEREIEAVIRSKWTRWVADDEPSTVRRTRAYKLCAFVYKMGQEKLDELVRGTFASYDTVGTPARGLHMIVAIDTELLARAAEKLAEFAGQSDDAAKLAAELRSHIK